MWYKQSQNILYHGTSNKAADNIKKKGFQLSSEHKGYANTIEQYISLTKNPEIAKQFAEISGLHVDKIKGGTILKIDQNSLKIADSTEIPWQSEIESFLEYLDRLRQLGFDAVDLSNDEEFGTGEEEIALINYDKAKFLE